MSEKRDELMFHLYQVIANSEPADLANLKKAMEDYAETYNATWRTLKKNRFVGEIIDAIEGGIEFSEEMHKEPAVND